MLYIVYNYAKILLYSINVKAVMPSAVFVRRQYICLCKIPYVILL